MPNVKKGTLTRHRAKEWYGGGPSELEVTDPSTYRQVIQYFYYLQQVHDPESDINFFVRQITHDLKAIWSSINPRLPLITDKSIHRKVRDLVCLVKDINRKHGKANQKRNLDDNIDKLFDISACSCPLESVSCGDCRVKCKMDDCSQDHIICICPFIAKVPQEDRAYLRDQRMKTGPKGSYQMSSVDFAAVRRDRKSEQSNSRKRWLEVNAEVEDSSDQSTDVCEMDETSTHAEVDDNWQPKRNTVGEYSTLKLPRYAMELVRGDCSSTLGAALGNALLHDIKHLLKPEVDINTILMDKCKVDRAKAKVRVISEAVMSHQNTQLICIGIDGKVDDNTMSFCELETLQKETVLKKCVQPEHHLTFTMEDGLSAGRYLTHWTIPIIGATGEVLAQETLSVLEEYDSIHSILAVLVDNTASNIGDKKGLVVTLEAMLGRNLHTVGCTLHQNELPLRALFKKLDGETTGPKSFSGSIGKCCSEEMHFQPQVQFQVVETPLTDGFIPDSVRDDLSNDQRLLYEYCKGIGSGRVDDRWAVRKIGPLCHARWLTLAIRILCCYTRNTRPTVNLIKLVYYIVRVYAPAWFEIKASSKLHDSPRLLFNVINRLQSLPFDDVKHIVMQNIQGNAYCLLPENFLYAMVKDKDNTIRNLALQTILDNRTNHPGDSHLKKIIPQVTWNAQHWTALIDLTNLPFREPPTTKRFTNIEIKSFIDNNNIPDISDLPSHSQSVERSVKLVTEAAHTVYGFDNRHRCVMTKLLSRMNRPVFQSKGHYSQSYDDVCV
ncbi:MAG TPA: hypothetical protein VJR22_07525 [Candidatus Nitrosotalea sp.]|nr:hypothetical protein [Candidatus Nitrosotalea sp.]